MNFLTNFIQYDEPLFRPPGEADSLILQVTLGCSWNKCAFCDMYSSKTYRARSEEEVINEIVAISKLNLKIRKVFLADGNPMVLSTSRLLNILQAIKLYLPSVRRVSTYALPSNVLSKTEEELRELKNAGLSMLYVGIESGDAEVLKIINKSETVASTISGLIKAKESGMKLSVIILHGLGGKKYSEQHAINSARILNEIQPEFLSSLILSFPYGEKRYMDQFQGDYLSMTPIELLLEMSLFLQSTELSGTVYRSNHASNYLALSGTLPKDKDRMLNQLQYAIKNPDIAGLRDEWERGF